MNNTVKKKNSIDWEVVAVYVGILLFVVYLSTKVKNDISHIISKENIKEEYKIELIDQDSIKVYSISNDTVYKGTIEEFHEIVHMDNL